MPRISMFYGVLVSMYALDTDLSKYISALEKKITLNKLYFSVLTLKDMHMNGVT